MADDDLDDDDKTPRSAPRARSHWDDAQRAEVGRDRRTPPLGVPSSNGTEQTQRHGLPLAPPRDPSEFTPVKHLLDTIDDPQLKRVARLVWEHTANVEMRSEQRMGSDAMRTELDDAKTAVKTLYARAWWLFTVFVGAVGAAVVKLVIIGRAYGDMETEIHALKDRVQLLESVEFLNNRVFPALTPGKDPQ